MDNSTKNANDHSQVQSPSGPSPLTGSNSIVNVNDSKVLNTQANPQENKGLDQPIPVADIQTKNSQIQPNSHSQNISTGSNLQNKPREGEPQENKTNSKRTDKLNQQTKSTSKTDLSSNAGISEVDYKGKTIAEILREKGKIQPEQEKEVRFEVANSQADEEEVLTKKGWVQKEEIVKAKAASYGIPFVDLDSIDINRELLMKLPYEAARTHKAIVFREDSSLFHVGMADPLDIQRVNYIQSILGKSVKAYFASETDIKIVLDTKYAGQMESQVTEAVEDIGEGIVEIEEGIQDISEVEDTIASAPVARIVNMILEYAVKFEASDIHIEPREEKLAVRFRINGIMMERLQLPTSLIAPVVSRIKILSDLKIDEHRVPQDGRFQVKVGEKEVDLRVSVMPTVHGEKIVIRLLEKGAGLMKLENTGLRGSGYKIYREVLTSTQGIILVTGPTGSGKTQTLASSLLIVNQPDVNIVTLEDPVEIKIDGVNQIQVNADVGLTFAKGLRSVLRQDPDIIMVGEIRDQETAELAVQASLTGHLVLATLHTNSAAGALPRLLDMDLESYLLTSTINVIVAQRLVRTLCDACKEAYHPNEQILKKIHKVMSGLAGFDMFSYPKSEPVPGEASATQYVNAPPIELAKQKEVQEKKKERVVLYKAKGCNKCNNTGYDGRTGIFEVLRVSEKIAQMIMENKSATSIEKQAIEEGMITMIQDGFFKALEGITSLEEVLRVQKK